MRSIGQLVSFKTRGVYSGLSKIEIVKIFHYIIIYIYIYIYYNIIILASSIGAMKNKLTN